MAKHGDMTLDELEATINVIGGPERAKRLRKGDLRIVPRESALLKLLDGDTMSVDRRDFNAREAFTRENGFVYFGHNVSERYLSLVEGEVPAANLRVSELLLDARDFRVASELDMDTRGTVSLVHFFVHLQIKGGFKGERKSQEACRGVVAFICGKDFLTRTFFAYMRDDGWHLSSFDLGSNHTWPKGTRFLHR
jgi:hypothetical protein